jgi:hypothetical protein
MLRLEQGRGRRLRADLELDQGALGLQAPGLVAARVCQYLLI